jgi:hypothetical protein
MEITDFDDYLNQAAEDEQDRWIEEETAAERRRRQKREREEWLADNVE